MPNEHDRWSHNQHPDVPGWLTPTQAVKKYNLQLIRWNATTLGRLRAAGLLISYHDRVLNVHYIYEPSLLKILAFYNGVQDDRKLDLGE